MSVEETLRREAREAAERGQYRVSGLEREVSALEGQLAKNKGDLDAARLAPQRLADFQVRLGSDYQCPRCWIDQGVQKPLHTVGSNTNDDIFRCRRCNAEFVVAYQ